MTSPRADALGQWHEYAPKSPFGRLIGPFQRMVQDDQTYYRIEIREHHRNEAGILHGGAVVAIVDEIVGSMVKDRHGREHVTVQLTTAFLAPVDVGTYLRPTCDIIRATRSLVFVESKLMVADKAVAASSLIFKLRPDAVRPEAASGPDGYS